MYLRCSTMVRTILLLCLLTAFLDVTAQSINGLVAKYTFERGDPANDAGGDSARIVGATPTVDRFGNRRSAYYLHGNTGSYINLGTSARLKLPEASFSIWFRMDNIMYAGRGYDCNPLIIAKTHAGNDFNEAINLSFEYVGDRLSAVSNNVGPQDSLQAGVRTAELIKRARWYHVVLVYDDSSIALYLDGVLQNKVAKKFRTTFLAGDSLIIGYSANAKNVRYFNGSVDDIQVFDRVLTDDEILGLYRQENPHQGRNVVLLLLSILCVVLCILMIMGLLLRRERARSKKQRQIFEMETQIMRAQMNPHFIFNAINSVQQFILEEDNENANKYLVKFSRLLRMILESNSEEYITLDKELDILSRYIEIEALRFDHSFKYTITVEAALNPSRVRIPQMMIQPFVENAIWHGLLRKNSDKRLSLSFSYVDSLTLSCRIEDNGVGFYAKKSPDVLKKNRSLAINFIRQRLELMNRELRGEYSLSIGSVADNANGHEGTCIIITLPILY